MKLHWIRMKLDWKLWSRLDSVYEALSSHIENKTNPHKTTPKQVEALPISGDATLTGNLTLKWQFNFRNTKNNNSVPSKYWLLMSHADRIKGLSNMVFYRLPDFGSFRIICESVNDNAYFGTAGVGGARLEIVGTGSQRYIKLNCGNSEVAVTYDLRVTRYVYCIN